MSLFSLDNILLNENNNYSNDKIIDIDNIGYLDVSFNSHSFIQEGYDFILEMNNHYMDAEKTFYTIILGSYGDNKIINESFSGFFDKIKSIIRKFIEWIKKVFKEFVVKINALFSAEKYLKKNSKLFVKFNSDDEFEFNGYTFTNIENSDIPKASALNAFTKDASADGVFKADNIYAGNSNDKTAMTTNANSLLDSKIDALNNGLEDFYDAFRGEVIGKSEKFDSTEFAEELFKLFRSDETSPSMITIDATFVSEAYRRFEKNKDVVKSIEKTQKDIIKDYEALERYLDKMIKINKEGDINKIGFSSYDANSYIGKNVDILTGGSADSISGSEIYNTSTSDKMNNYIKIQSAKVNQMCAIHTQAFSAKLEAAKNCFSQDKKILYKALSQIVKRSNKDNY